MQIMPYSSNLEVRIVLLIGYYVQNKFNIMSIFTVTKHTLIQSMDNRLEIRWYDNMI